MSNKNTTQPGFNSDVNTWNIPVNANTQNFDDAMGTVQSLNLGGVTGTVNITGGAFVGAYPANTPSYVPMTLALTGAPSGTVSLKFASGQKGRWIVNNACTGTHAGVSVGIGSNLVTCFPGVSEVYTDGTSAYFLPRIDVGTCVVWAGGSSNIPTGFLQCNNNQYSTSTYPALFAVINYTFGGSGSNFKVPSAPATIGANLVWVIRAV